MFFFYQASYRQSYLWLHDHCLEVLTVDGNELQQDIPPTAPDVAVVDTIFNVFSYGTRWWAEIQTLRLPDNALYPPSNLQATNGRIYIGIEVKN